MKPVAALYHAQGAAPAGDKPVSEIAGGGIAEPIESKRGFFGPDLRHAPWSAHKCRIRSAERSGSVSNPASWARRKTSA